MGHASYNGCPKCNQKCDREGHRKKLRTDDSFSSRLHIEHHCLTYRQRKSPLENANIGMVSQFV